MKQCMARTKIHPWLLGMMAMVALFLMAYPAHAQRTTASSFIPEIPEIIFAAGDIAKCDGDHSKWEEFLKLVGIFPESVVEEKKEPALHKLLELVGVIEETDYYANAEDTAHLLNGQKGRILAVGDLGYPIGSPRSFNKCYDRTWGPLKGRTFPVPGNHEYKTKGAGPYFAYWGSRAGDAGKGYYSFDLGGWHIIALNSKLEKSESHDTVTTQQAWLQQDLATTNARCILAFWHHTLFSSGQHGGISKDEEYCADPLCPRGQCRAHWP